ncbi:MAG: hypothetical protein H6726_26070 [Sandaracinaceae bacterium]|nr:hypothetical protein [Myxococcales bacterium]MCB9661142.1 hypothetical protein [Sandaracinaceae bacterium]
MPANDPRHELRASLSSLLAPAVCLLGLVGCVQLDGFDTGVEHELVGPVFGPDDRDCDDLARCSFIRRGFGAETELHMTFDPENVQAVAGSLSSSGEACGQPTFTNVPLIAIEALQHDQLSRFEVPGDGRVKNYIFSLSPISGPLAGRDVMAFVSLLRSERVEVRIIAGSGQNACDPNDCDQIAAGGCDYFGVFSLERKRL